MRKLAVFSTLAMLTCMPNGRVSAQVITGTWVAESGDWNVADNWDLDGSPNVPDGTFGDNASIANGGTALVGEAVPSVAGLSIGNGVLAIADGGSLEIIPDELSDPPQMGDVSVGADGTLNIASGGTLTVAGGVANTGVVSLAGGSANLNIAGDWSGAGAIAPVIDGSGVSAVAVTGAATLAGSLAPTLDGVVPSFGDSWDVLTAGSISGGFASINEAGLPSLDRGLQYQSVVDGGTAKLTVGNSLVLTIDRESGDMTVSNPDGAAIDAIGYGIQSANGLLNADGFVGLSGGGVEGWQTANLTDAHLSELNLSGSSSLAVNDSLSLGGGYAAGPQGPSMEDVVFTFATSDNQIFTGIVEYTGPVNDIVLNVNPETGEAAISQLSTFLADIDVTGYTVLSEAGSLNTEGWASLQDSGAAGDGWLTANPAATGVSELNLDSFQTFDTGTVVGLGNLFTPGAAQDLMLQIATADGQFLTGSVLYGDIPDGNGGGDPWPGDANGDGTTDLADFNILKSNFNTSGGLSDGDFNDDGQVDLADFNILKSNFNTSAPVPEPTSLALLGLALGGFVWLRRRRA